MCFNRGVKETTVKETTVSTDYATEYEKVGAVAVTDQYVFVLKIYDYEEGDDDLGFYLSEEAATEALLHEALACAEGFERTDVTYESLRATLVRNETEHSLTVTWEQPNEWPDWDVPENLTLYSLTVERFALLDVVK